MSVIAIFRQQSRELRVPHRLPTALVSHFWPVSNHFMGAAQRDYRPIGLGVAVFVVVMAIVIAAVFCPKTPFEREHARAEAANPKWVRVEISTADNRQEYRENEPIYIVPRFSSTARSMYKIEIAEAQSKSAIDFLHISNGQVVPRNLTGILCCFSHLVGLDDEPYSPKTATTLTLPPGRYEIYLTTRRVFPWDSGPEEYSPSSFEVASNMLKIRVVPDRR